MKPSGVALSDRKIRFELPFLLLDENDTEISISSCRSRRITPELRADQIEPETGDSRSRCLVLVSFRSPFHIEFEAFEVHAVSLARYGPILLAFICLASQEYSSMQISSRASLWLFAAIFAFLHGIGEAQEVRTIKFLQIDHDGKNLREVFDFEDTVSNVGSPAVSPDGTRLAFDATPTGEAGSKARLMILNLQSRELQDLGPGAMPTWAHDGTSLAYSSYDPRGVFERSLDGNVLINLDTGGWSIRFSPSGDQHAYTRGNQFVVTNLDTGETRIFQPNPDAPYRQIYWNFSWSTDERRIAFMGVRQDGVKELAVVDAWAEKPQSYACCEADGYSNRLEWRPGSEQIFIRKDRPLHQIYHFQAVENAELVHLIGQPADRSNTEPACSRDGKILYFSSHIKTPKE